MKMPRPKRIVVGFWLVTALFCLQMGFTAYAQLSLPQVAAAFTHLGFPDYFRVQLSLAKLIGVVLQHWILLATSWPDGRRSLWKAAGVIRAGLPLLVAAADDLDRLTDVLNRLRVVIAAVARVTARKEHPSSFQLLMHPVLLDWQT